MRRIFAGRGKSCLRQRRKSMGLEWSHYQTRGEVRCASGDRIGGLADLTRSIQSQTAVSSPNHPWAARARAVAGLCALGQGTVSRPRNLLRRRDALLPAAKRQPLRRLDKHSGQGDLGSHVSVSGIGKRVRFRSCGVGVLNLVSIERVLSGPVPWAAMIG